MVNAHKHRRKASFAIAMIQILLLLNSVAATTPHLYAQSTPGHLRLVRFMKANRVQIQSPASLLFMETTESFLVLHDESITGDRSAQSQITAITAYEDRLGATTLPQKVEPYNVAHDAKGERLFFFDAAKGQLLQFTYHANGLPIAASMKTVDLPGQIGALQGMAMGTDGQSLYLLESDTLQIRKLDLKAGQLQSSALAPIHLRQHGLSQARALAVHPQSGHLFTTDPTTRRLYELTSSGVLVNYYDLAAAEIADVQGLTFAPSADRTDDPDQVNLYITDRQPETPSMAQSVPLSANLRPSAYLPLIISHRSTSVQPAQAIGRIAELTFEPLVEPVMAASITNVGTLVQTIKTYEFSPPSPDPSGIAYISNTPYLTTGDRLLISDAEVDEMPIYAGANLFEITRNGVLQRTYTTITNIRRELTEEPAGATFNPNNGHLFFSDDDNIRPVIEIAPGPDKIYRTSDDIVTKYSTRQYYGMDDPEGIEYARIGNSDWLFLVDGLNSELYAIQPGPNGKFDGVDDVKMNFDTQVLGVSDPEGIAYHPTRGTLFIVGKPNTRIAEITTNGVLVRYIDITAAKAVKPAGLAFAPGSQNPNQWNLYVVDRNIDNDKDPNENDGLLYEIAIPAAGNLPPTVDAGADLTVILPASTDLNGTVTDDGQPDPPAAVTVTWSKVSGPGVVTFGNPNSKSTTATFSLPGDYVLQLTANDGAASSSDTTNVKALVVNQPPTVNAGTDQAVEIGATVTLSAQISDDGLPNPPNKVTVTWSKVSGPGTVTFTTSNNATTTAGFSAVGDYVLRVTASDSLLNASDEITVHVLAANTAPTVNAGADQLIGYNDATQLAGSVTDDGLPNPPSQVTVTWSKVSGPGNVLFTATNQLTTSATFSEVGVYVLRLTASDSVLSAQDEVTITVGPSNQPPTVDAGPDQTIFLGATATMAGSVSDDGIPNPPNAVTITWHQQSGPGSAIFSDPHALTTTVSFTVPGEYLLRLSADDGAQKANDTVTIIVNDPQASTLVVGQSQVTEVGKGITLTATISGAWAVLPSGALTYQWSQVSGPGPVTLTAPTALKTTATFTTPGEYLLQITVTHGNQVISDRVVVRVNTINQAPNVNAGGDQRMARPGALQLTASITDDGLPSNNLAVQWTRVSGPAEVLFADSTSATTTATFTIAGTYVLKVTASDGKLTGEDTLMVEVGNESVFTLFLPVVKQ